jgi:hypothetical protein
VRRMVPMEKNEWNQINQIIPNGIDILYLSIGSSKEYGNKILGACRQREGNGLEEKSRICGERLWRAPPFNQRLEMLLAWS